MPQASDTFADRVERDPQNVTARYNLAAALSAQGRLTDAAQAYREVLKLDPDMFAAIMALADTCDALGRLDEMEECYQRALTLKPDSDEVHFRYGGVLQALGRIDESIASYRRALDCNPDLWYVRSNLVYVMNFSADLPPEAIFCEHVEWDRRHAAPLGNSIKRHANVKDPHRRLRIGYLSSNFKNHVMTSFFEPTLRHHDAGRFDIYCYSDVAEPDQVTQRLRAYPCVWREIAGQMSEDVASLVRSDGIDILVDLNGHTAGHRLLVFARKPAPIQVTWNGYPNTTGLATIDYRITDRYADPPGTTEHLHTERLVRLPEIYMAFQPPEHSPALVPPPSVRNGHVTFGSFNVFHKIGPGVIAVWAQILAALPTARLLMLTVPEGKTRARVEQAFSACGIDPQRLELIGRVPSQEFLEAHQRADIALDPFPFHGTTTTCQTLWMGVPVVTLAGATHVSRVGVSMLSNLGLERMIARDKREYVSIAVALAQDTAELARLRASLRASLRVAPNTDGARLTRHLEAEYAKMWSEYCMGAES